MKRIIPLLVTGWLFGCINVPEIETGGGTARPDAGENTPRDAGTVLSDLTVTITEPTDTVYASTVVTVSVEVRGGVADTVQLLRDGALLATLTSPFRYTWDTTGEAERGYTLTARALRASKRFDSAPVTVVVDRTNLQVASRSPSTGSTNVDYSLPIHVVFTKPVKASTVSDTTVSFAVAGVLTDKTLSLSSDGKTLTLKPKQRPALPATFTIGLSRGITDLAGNALVVPTTAWSFEVPDWYALGEPLRAVSEQNGQQQDPTIALSKDGEPIIAWSEQMSSDERASIFVSKWDGKAFTPVGQPINGTAKGSAYRPTMAIAGDGNPVVAWHESDGFNENIYVKKWTGSIWQTVGTGALSAIRDTRSSPVATPALNPSIAIHGNDIYVAWQEMTIDHYSTIQVWSSINGAQFKSADSSSSGISAVARETSGSNPSLAIDNTGRPVVAFQEQTLQPSRTTNIYIFRLQENGHWQPLGPEESGDDVSPYQPGGLSAEEGNTSAKKCVLAIDSSGDIYLAWSEEALAGETENAYVFRLANGQPWLQIGGPISALAGYSPVKSVSMQVLANAMIVVSWVEFSFYQGGFSHLYTSHWRDNKWTVTTLPYGTNENKESAYQASFTTDKAGRTFIMHSRTEPSRELCVQRRNN